MKNDLLAGAAAATLLLVGGVALAQTTPDAHGARHARMMKTQTRTDVQARAQKMFARLDANHDGFITKDEISAMQAKRSQKMAERAQHFDPSKMFDRLDSNHDGQVTQAEADAVRGTGRLFARADTNKDGVITRAEFDIVAGKMHARMQHASMMRGHGRLFDTADTDKDGRVSLAEMQGLALQHFDRADLNHDGSVTPQERQQMRQQWKSQHHPS